RLERRCGLERHLPRRLRLRMRAESLALADCDHDVASADRARGMLAGVVSLRVLDEPDQERRFGHGHARDGLAEGRTRGTLHAIQAATHVHLVHVQLEHATLAERILHGAGHAYLADLPPEAVSAGQLLREDVARELHRDRAEPFVE